MSDQHPDLDTEYLTVGETAAQLEVHADTVRRWANSGQLKSIRTPGNQRRFRRQDVEALLAGEAS